MVSLLNVMGEHSMTISVSRQGVKLTRTTIGAVAMRKFPSFEHHLTSGMGVPPYAIQKQLKATTSKTGQASAGPAHPRDASSPSAEFDPAPARLHLAICGGERSPSRGLRIAVCLQLPYCPALRLNFARIQSYFCLCLLPVTRVTVPADAQFRDRPRRREAAAVKTRFFALTFAQGVTHAYLRLHRYGRRIGMRCVVNRGLCFR